MPIPGTNWLNRLESEPFIYKNEEWSSAYAAILGHEINPCQNLNAYINSIFFSPAIAAKTISLTDSLFWSHVILSYLRTLIAGTILYYGVAGTFHYFCYVHPSTSRAFAKRPRPTWDTIKNQICLAQASLTCYVMFPLVDELLIEAGWTKVYFTVDEIGGYLNYFLYLVLYMTLVEIGIYWMHRTLHTNKILYKHIHLRHHAYKSPETLTPWASIAFHPLDGLLQASPYVIVVLVVPCHYPTHLMMMFFTEVWATYIHDSMDWNFGPIMGSKYHTVHHTHFVYNYGQIFIFCDWFWGTLRVPIHPTGGPQKQVLKKPL